MVVIAQSFETVDMAVAEHALGDIYPDFNFQEPGPAESFRYAQEVSGDENVLLAATVFDGTVSAKAELDRAFAVVFVESGRFGLWNGPRRTDAGRPALALPGEVSSLLDHTSIVMANFTQAAVEETVRAYHGVDRVDLAFPNVSPIDRQKDQLWRTSVNYVRDTILVGDVIHNDGIRNSALRTLSLIAIDVFGIQTVMATPPGTGAGAATVRRAQAFMDENADKPITIEQIASASHVSVSGLQHGFRRILEITPLEYLRRVRMDAARAELAESNPGQTEVRQVALRWGFPHAGRFSASYLQAFGELPSSTLRN